VIYKFKSKAAGDVIMLGPNGDQILHILGREPAAKGIFEPADMPSAIAAIEAAVAADEAERARANAEAAAKGAPPLRGEVVTLRQRAWPLIEMMKRAHQADQPIVWGV
jgi:Domain of unknown function (DUF1840)